MPSRALTPTPPHDVVWQPLSVKEILARFRGKLLLTSEQITEMGDGAYLLAWSVAKSVTMAVLQALRESLAVSIEEGQTFEQWRDGLGDVVQRFTDAHLENIFRTTLGNAYEAQRFEELTRDEFVEYLMFDGIHDDRICEEICLPLDGSTWPRDEFPAEYWPPLHFQDRCTVIPVDANEIEAVGGTLRSGMVSLTDGRAVHAMAGFGNAPSIKGLSDQVSIDLKTHAAKWGWSQPPTTTAPPKE